MTAAAKHARNLRNADRPVCCIADCPVGGAAADQRSAVQQASGLHYSSAMSAEPAVPQRERRQHQEIQKR
jgi:hypothetical protein